MSECNNCGLTPDEVAGGACASVTSSDHDWSDPFASAAIDQDERDRERYESGWLAGYAAADARRAALAEAYALVAADVEALVRETSDIGAMDALLVLRERAGKLEPRDE